MQVSVLIKIKDSPRDSSRLKLVRQPSRENISADDESIKAHTPTAVLYQMFRDTRDDVKHRQPML